MLAIDGMLDAVGGPGGVKQDTLSILDEEFVNLLGRDVVLRQLRPPGVKALRVVEPDRRGTLNIRHDRNSASSVYASMVTYLNDGVDGLEGGHTIFPTLRPVKHEQALDMHQQELSDYLHKTYDTALRDHDQSHDLIEQAGNWSVDAVKMMCASVGKSSKTHYFAVKPRLGITLLWFSFVGKRKGSYSAEVGEHWHAECGHNMQRISLERFALLRQDLMPG